MIEGIAIATILSFYPSVFGSTLSHVSLLPELWDMLSVTKLTAVEFNFSTLVAIVGIYIRMHGCCICLCV